MHYTEKYLLNAIARVRELHSPTYGYNNEYALKQCAICEVKYPCPTIKALDGEQ